MEYKLIGNLSPIIHLYADERNYVLIIRKSAKQEMRNGHHMYFLSLSRLFAELFEHQVRANLANDLDKSADEMIEIINSTRKQILDLIEPYERLREDIKG